MAREDLVFNRMSRVFKRLGSHLGTVFTIGRNLHRSTRVCSPNISLFS
nr:MAG TPA: hypothetical protein [Caudoviricetes sp.]